MFKGFHFFLILALGLGFYNCAPKKSSSSSASENALPGDWTNGLTSTNTSTSIGSADSSMGDGSDSGDTETFTDGSMTDSSTVDNSVYTPTDSSQTTAATSTTSASSVVTTGTVQTSHTAVSPILSSAPFCQAVTICPTPAVAPTTVMSCSYDFVVSDQDALAHPALAYVTKSMQVNQLGTIISKSTKVLTFNSSSATLTCSQNSILYQLCASGLTINQTFTQYTSAMSCQPVVVGTTNTSTQPSMGGQ